MQLDLGKRSVGYLKKLELMGQRFVGQDDVVRKVIHRLELIEAGLCRPGRPQGVFLFLGPTGTGKTKLAEVVSEILHGEQMLLKIDCAEFQHSHEVAKLIGSPPGYLGHRETHPFLSQEMLSNVTNPDRCRTAVVLFDEIDKASDALWNLLLGILDKATLTLGDNRRVDFSDTLIFMTCNVGSSEIQKVTGIKDFGFGGNTNTHSQTNQKVTRVGINAVRRKFTPEFLNRMDGIDSFRTFTHEEYRRIVHIEIGQIKKMILNSGRKFVFTVTEKVIDFFLEHLIDPEYGARPLKRQLDVDLLDPIAHLITTQQVQDGDWISIDYINKGTLSFQIIGRDIPIRKLYEIAVIPLPEEVCDQRYMTATSRGGLTEKRPSRF